MTTTESRAAQHETARPDASGHDAAAFLEVAGLEVHLPTGPRREIQAVQSVSLRVHRGERVGIVGESGSGKSVTGRAIAGLNGDRTARIFCLSLQAELVSIAGLYRVMDDIDRKTFKKSVKIHLDADRLCIDLLS